VALVVRVTHFVQSLTMPGEMAVGTALMFSLTPLFLTYEEDNRSFGHLKASYFLTFHERSLQL
jgi:hypothetical protein